METAKQFLRFNESLQEIAGKISAWLCSLLVLVI
jgi:hypothetical protein